MKNSFQSAIALLISLGFSFGLLSCDTNTPHEKKASHIVDAFDRNIEIPLNPQRVISLCPSQTECLLKIIDSSQLIGVTSVCNFPYDLIKYKTRINSYPPDYEKIVSLKPDLVVSLKGMIKLDEVQKLENLGIKVLVQKADSLKHIAANFRELGHVFEKKALGDSLAQLVELRLMQKVKTKDNLTYLFLFSYDPLYAFGEGNFLNEVFENNGFKNIVTRSKFKVPFPIISREYILKNQPDLLFASSGNILKNLPKKYTEMQNLSVFKHQNIDSVNNDICSRPTLRLLTIDSMLKQKIYQQSYNTP